MSDNDARWIDAALGEDAEFDDSIEPIDGDGARALETYRRVVGAVRAKERPVDAPDHVLQKLLRHQRAMTADAANLLAPQTGTPAWKAHRLAPLSAAFALVLAFFTSGLPTLLDPPAETFTVMTGATHVPSAPLRGGFHPAAPEFSADPEQDELDTMLVVASGAEVLNR